MNQQIVETAANKLDEKIPGWENLIDLERFKWVDSLDCIRGQLIEQDKWRFDVENYSAFGYSSDYDLSLEETDDAVHPKMTAWWRNEIETRRANQGILQNVSIL